MLVSRVIYMFVVSIAVEKRPAVLEVSLADLWVVLHEPLVFTDGIGTPDPNAINCVNWCF